MDTQVDQILFTRDTVLSYLELAGATCMIYDHLTTLDIEIETVWNRPKWQIPQGLFFINRYFGLSSQIEIDIAILLHLSSLHKTIAGTVYGGETFNLVSGSLTGLTFFAMHGIMAYRISCMYTHDPKISRILVIAYVTEFLSLVFIQIVGKIYGSNEDNSDIIVETSVDFCAREMYSSWTFIVWIPVVLFEFLIWGLALALGIRYYHAVGRQWMFSDYKKTPLLYILLRDSITFPFIFSLFCILNLITFGLIAAGSIDHAVAHITFIFPVVLSVIFGSRLILNLRESYYEPGGQEFSIRVDTLIDSENNQNSLHLPTTIPHPNLATPPTADN